MNSFTTFVKRHDLLAFFILAYALAWWPALVRPLYPDFPLPQFDTGPFLAALIILGMTGGRTAIKSFLGRIVQWRVGLRWYLVALLLPLVLIVAGIFLVVLLGLPAPTAAQLSNWPSVIFFFLLFLVFPIAAPLGEEPGWRGFAQPRLLVGRSALSASLILGCLWAGWHLPLIFMHISSWALIPLILPSAIIMTWIYLHTNGSVLLAIIYHASFDAVTNLVADIYRTADQNVLLLALAAVFWVAALILIVITGSSLTRRKSVQANPISAVEPILLQ